MSRHYPSLATIILLSSVTALSAAEPIDIGSRRELFVDQRLIEKLDNAKLTLHHPQAREVAIRFDSPWEGNTGPPPTPGRW